MNTLLNIENDVLDQFTKAENQYVRILGFNEKGQQHIKKLQRNGKNIFIYIIKGIAQIIEDRIYKAILYSMQNGIKALINVAIIIKIKPKVKAQFVKIFLPV